MDNFFTDRKTKIDTYKKDIRKRQLKNIKVNIPDGLFIKCDECNELIYQADLKNNLEVCPKCNYHFKINARVRLSMIVDKNSFVELDKDLTTVNVLDFPEYLEKVTKYQKQTNEKEAFISGYATILNKKVAIGVLDSHFMMGSMGSVVGEKVTRLVEYSTNNKLPLIIFIASGGARMQEGIFSLMQMAKTSAALKYHNKAGLLYISVLTNPTTGGVSASFASLGDIIIAEKSSIIGFAGLRVIKQTINQELPDSFQTETFQLQKGFADIVATRKELRLLLHKLLLIHNNGDKNE